MTLKNLLSGLLLLLGLAGPAAAQAPAWQLALASRGGTATTSALATGPDGAVYLAGSFSGDVQFGAVRLASEDNAEQHFVARWNPAASEFAWVYAVPVDLGITHLAARDSTVFIAGTFSSQELCLGPLAVTNLDTTRQGSWHTTDIGVVRLRDAGHQAVPTGLWRVGSPASDASYALAVTAGALYVAGIFEGAYLRVGPDSLPGPKDNPAVRGTRFLARLNEQQPGQADWLLPIGDDYNSYGSYVAGSLPLAVAGSSLYLALDISGANALGARLTGSQEVLVKLADDGRRPHLVWAERLADTRVDALAVDGASLYVAGIFAGDTLRLGRQRLAGRPHRGTFVALLLDAGNGLQLRGWQQVGTCESPLLLAATAGHVYLAVTLYVPRLYLPFRVRRHWISNVTDVVVAQLGEAGEKLGPTWVATIGIRGLWRSKWRPGGGVYRHGHELKPRYLNLGALLAAGPLVYVAGSTEGVTRFGRRRLRYPVRGRAAAFLAALPAAP